MSSMAALLMTLSLMVVLLMVLACVVRFEIRYYKALSKSKKFVMGKFIC